VVCVELAVFTALNNIPFKFNILQAMHVYGYHQGLAQCSALFRLSVPTPATLDVARVDVWLTDFLAIKVPAVEALSDAQNRGMHLGAHPIAPLDLWARVLAVYGGLSRACEMPCVELGRLVGLKHQAHNWQLTLAVPTVNGVDPQVFKALLSHAFRITNDLMATPPSVDNAQAVYARIEQTVLSRYKGVWPSGRANSFVASLAHKLGVPFDYMGAELMRLGQGSKRQITQRSACLMDSAISAKACGDKVSTALLLRQAGLPAPVHVLVKSLEQAQAAALQLGWPVVIKPTDRERSEGVTVDVNSAEAVAQGYEAASRWSRRILVERQVAGVCHRIFVVGDRFVFASKRQPKSVKGDGVSSVQALVEAANREQLKRPTWSRLKPWVLDEVAMGCLNKAGLTPDSVLPEGQLAALRPFTSNDWGGSADEVTQTIHPDNVRLAIDAAKTLGLRVAGVDLISTDITRPWHENGAILNEVNFKPYLSGNLDNDKLHPYLQSLVDGDGRIPVHAVVGHGDLWAKARALRQHLKQTGVWAHVCGHSGVETPSGEPLHLVGSGLFMRCRAMLQNPSVEALIVVVDSDEFLKTGLPLDRFDEVHLVGKPTTATVSTLWRQLMMAKSSVNNERIQSNVKIVKSQFD
jgi:cyanophycin synthetase